MDNSIGNMKTMVSGPDKHGGYTLSSGDKLGQYKIISPLGRGGMGEVYLAEHAILTTRHAVKLLPAERSDSAGFIDRFHDEARVMARLDHPGIVKVQYADEQSGRHYLVMEFVGVDATEEPFDLEEALAKAPDNRLAPDVAARLGMQIADAVGSAHTAGVVHRDLKPANVLLTSRDLAKASARVTDFGLARLLGEDWVRSVIDVSIRQSILLRQGSGGQVSIGGAPTMMKAREDRSSTGSILGTYEYMSPEQRDGAEVDERSDIYALGVMLYRMVTGKKLMGRAKAASKIVPGLQKAWDDLIDACLEESPADRPEDMRQVSEMLGPLMETNASRQASLSGRGPLMGDADSPHDASVHIRSGEPRFIAKTLHRSDGDVFLVDLGNDIELEMIWIPAGAFLMGSPEGSEYDGMEKQHRVTFSRRFLMGKFEVTQEQWHAVMGNNPSHFKGANLPVEKVSWDDCQGFIEKLNGGLHGSGSSSKNPGAFRLPTEAEWEYACRAGTTSELNNDKELTSTFDHCLNLDEVGWYAKNSDSKTHPVGQKKPNAWGLYDMHGNVHEWCQDFWKTDYPHASVIDPTGPERGDGRVFRGGSWFDCAAHSRSSARSWGLQSNRWHNLGFRLVKTA